MTTNEKPSSPCITFLGARESDCRHCALRSTALFARLDASELDSRLKPIHNGIIKADSVVYREGDPADAVFTVRSGVVKLVGSCGGGTARILRLLGRGAAIGLEAMDRKAFEHTAIAMREVSLCRIPKDLLLDLVDSNHRLTVGLINKWHEHASWSDRWVSALYAGHVSERTVALIRMLVDVSGDPLEAVRLPRTSDMADILRCSPEGISRCMAGLKRRRLLQRVAPWTYRCSPSLIGCPGEITPRDARTDRFRKHRSKSN